METEKTTLPYASGNTVKPLQFRVVIVSFCLTGVSALGFAGLAALWNWGPSHGRSGDEQASAAMGIVLLSLPFVMVLLASAILSIVGLVQSRGSWQAWLAAALAGGPFLFAGVEMVMGW